MHLKMADSDLTLLVNTQVKQHIDPEELKRIESSVKKCDKNGLFDNSAMMQDLEEKLNRITQESGIEFKDVIKNESAPLPRFKPQLEPPPIPSRKPMPAPFPAHSDSESESSSESESDDESEDEIRPSYETGRPRESHDREATEHAIKSLGQRIDTSHLTPHEEFDVEKAIDEISINTHLLRDLGYTSHIPEYNSNMSIQEIKRTRRMLQYLVGREQYSDFFIEIIQSSADFLDAVFDGSHRIFGYIPLNYSGLSDAVRLKMSSGKMRPIVANTVTGFAQKWGYTADNILMTSLAFQLFSVPLNNYRKSRGSPTHAGTQENLARLQGLRH